MADSFWVRDLEPSSPKKPILRRGKFPIDFFGKSKTLNLKKLSLDHSLIS